MLVGAALAALQGLLVGEEHRRAFHLAVEQADQVGDATDLAQLPAYLKVAEQGGHGEPAGAGAGQVHAAAAGDLAADLDGLVEGLDIGAQAPFAVLGVGVAPTDDEDLQVVLQGVLDEALFRRQVEDVVLVDLRRHDQQGLGVLALAQRLVLDQFQHLVAEHHRALRGGEVATDLEGGLVHLAGHAAVVHQVFEQVADAIEQADPAGIEQFLYRQWIDQAVAGCHGVGEQGDEEAGAGAIVAVQVAFVDPGEQLLLPRQVGLQGAPVEGIEAPGWILEAGVLWVRLVQGVAQQHLAQLASEGDQVPRTVQRLAQAVDSQAADRRQQVLAAQADDGALCTHELGGHRHATRFLLFSHGPHSVVGPQSGCHGRSSPGSEYSVIACEFRFTRGRTAHLPEQGGCRPTVGQQALYHNAGRGVAELALSRRSQAPCAVAEH